MINRVFDPALTMADVEWLRDTWPGKLVIKGVQSVDDAVRVVDAGADGVLLSNHGGRQLDRAPVPLELVEPAVQALGGRAEVLVDTGIDQRRRRRRGRGAGGYGRARRAGVPVRADGGRARRRGEGGRDPPDGHRPHAPAPGRAERGRARPSARAAAVGRTGSAPRTRRPPRKMQAKSVGGRRLPSSYPGREERRCPRASATEHRHRQRCAARAGGAASPAPVAAPVPAPRVPAADRVGVGLAARRRAVARRPRVAGHRVGRRPVRPVGGGGGDEPRVGRRRADGWRGGRPLPEAGRAARRRGGAHGRPGRHRRPRPRRCAAGVVPRGAGVPRRRGGRLLLPDVVGGGTRAASRGRAARRERHRGDAASARPAGGRACAGRAAGRGLLPAGRAAGGRRRVPGRPAAV